MLKVGQLLLANVRNYPERIAIINETRSLTYLQLNNESNFIANGLKKLGVYKGDRVGLLLKNGVDWIISWYACHKIGAVVVPLHVRLRSDDLAAIAKIAGCSVLIYNDNFESTANEIKSLYKGLKFNVCIGNKSSDERSILWSSFYESADHSEAQGQAWNNDPALLLFTSGTTGKAKGVLRTQEMLVLHAMTLGLKNNSPHLYDIMMSTAPLYHIGGLQGLLKMHLLGGAFITMNGINSKEILCKIQEYKVTQLQMLPPVTYERLYMYEDWRKYNLSSIWEVCISAGKCTSEYVSHIFEMFPNSHLRPSWGSTETCSVTCCQIQKKELEADPLLINSVGNVMPMTEVRIVNRKGKDVTCGKPGEAWVRSPMVFHGYLKDKKNTRKVLRNDGWFRTGDIMRRDPETGYYYFLDRQGDVIKSGGENVFALEIERVLQRHPDIHECAVVGIPDLRFGEGIAAAVVLKPNCTIKQQEFLKFCEKELPNFKKPRYLAIMEQLPINSSGKVLKTDLCSRANELFTLIS